MPLQYMNFLTRTQHSKARIHGWALYRSQRSTGDARSFSIINSWNNSDGDGAHFPFDQYSHNPGPGCAIASIQVSSQMSIMPELHLWRSWRFWYLVYRLSSKLPGVPQVFMSLPPSLLHQTFPNNLPSLLIGLHSQLVCIDRHLFEFTIERSSNISQLSHRFTFRYPSTRNTTDMPIRTIGRMSRMIKRAQYLALLKTNLLLLPTSRII